MTELAFYLAQKKTKVVALAKKRGLIVLPIQVSKAFPSRFATF